MYKRNAIVKENQNTNRSIRNDTNARASEKNEVVTRKFFFFFNRLDLCLLFV